MMKNDENDKELEYVIKDVYNIYIHKLFEVIDMFCLSRYLLYSITNTYKMQNHYFLNFHHAEPAKIHPAGQTSIRLSYCSFFF